ncbi:MAG: hypothetical protein Q8N09_12315 [Thermodesulfovibrionia bacterium]|nr:hypothetical protein [Thermodesulfovibrionia bacterium]
MRLLSHCKEAYPNEACGILAGKPMARRGNEILKVYEKMGQPDGSI